MFTLHLWVLSFVPSGPFLKQTEHRTPPYRNIVIVHFILLEAPMNPSWLYYRCVTWMSYWMKHNWEQHQNNLSYLSSSVFKSVGRNAPSVPKLHQSVNLFFHLFQRAMNTTRPTLPRNTDTCWEASPATTAPAEALQHNAWQRKQSRLVWSHAVSALCMFSASTKVS